MNDSTIKLLGAITSLIAISYPFLLGLAKVVYQHLIDRLPAGQHALLDTITSTIVSGVEQSAAKTSMSSADKKAQAVQAVQTILSAHRMTVPDTMISLAIESAVFWMNSTKVPARPPASTMTATGQVTYPVSALPVSSNA